MEKRKVINSAVLLDSSSVTETAEGLRFTAVLKIFGRPNGNNEQAEPNAYDEFVNEYFGKAGYSLPLCYMHDERHILGVVEKMERDDEKLTVQCLVFAECPDFGYVSKLVRSGVLGGISDGSLCYGFADESGVFHVERAQMLEVSLVAIPAEIGASVMVSNTLASGFCEKEKEEARGVGRIFRPEIFE